MDEIARLVQKVIEFADRHNRTVSRNSWKKVCEELASHFEICACAAEEDAKEDAKEDEGHTS